MGSVADSINWQALGKKSPVLGYQVFEHDFSKSRGNDVSEGILRTGLEVHEQAWPVRGYVRGIRFDTFLVAQINTGPIAATWKRSSISTHRRYMFLLVNRGEVEIRGEGQLHFAPSKGVGVVLPGGAEVVLESRGATEGILLTFDMTEVEPLSVVSRVTPGLVVSSPVFHAAYSFFSAVAQAEEYDDIGSAYVLRGLTRDFARALVLESSDEKPQGDRISLAYQVMSHRYQSAAFTLDSLAQELGLSRRSLERAFADQGLRLAGELRRIRAKHAYVLLLEHPEMSARAVASASGFRSADVMRRALQRYGGSLLSDSRDLMHVPELKIQ